MPCVCSFSLAIQMGSIRNCACRSRFRWRRARPRSTWQWPGPGLFRQYACCGRWLCDRNVQSVSPSSVFSVSRLLISSVCTVPSASATWRRTPDRRRCFVFWESFCGKPPAPLSRPQTLSAAASFAVSGMISMEEISHTRRQISIPSFAGSMRSSSRISKSS